MSCCDHMKRREFLGLTTGLVAGVRLASSPAVFAGGKAAWKTDMWDPDRPFACTGKPLRVQPVLMYSTSRRRKMASWKSWGGVQTEQSASEEADRISQELKSLSAEADFALEVLPVVKLKSAGEASRVRKNDHDVLLVYPATGGGSVLRACISGEGDKLIFVRHRSGPVYGASMTDGRRGMRGKDTVSRLSKSVMTISNRVSRAPWRMRIASRKRRSGRKNTSRSPARRS